MASLAETLRQAGYVTPQGVTGPNAPLARQLKNYVTNVIPTATQNLAQQRADIDASLTMGDQGIQVGDREAFERQMAQVPNLMGLTAYHGTPHTIKGKFDISKVGTGEGAQAYGHGMYFAENPAVANEYARVLGSKIDVNGKPLYQANKTIGSTGNTELDDYLVANLGNVQATRKQLLSDIKEIRPTNPSAAKEMQSTLADLRKANVAVQDTGNLYKVDIPDEYIPKMIEWDKPFTKQPQNLQDIFAKVNPIAVLQKDPSNEFTRWLRLPSTSKDLQEMGYKGIKYKDAGSRGEGTKTFNYVVFDPTDVKILEQNSKPLTRKEILEQELKKVVE